MTDCLNVNIQVQQPAFCEDENGNPIPVYNWMSVRAYGPNVLHDTLLCGNTRITGPMDGLVPASKVMSVYLQGLIQENEPNSITPRTQGFGKTNQPNPPYNWAVRVEATPDTIGSYLTYIGQVYPPYKGIIGISNTYTKPLLCRFVLTASVTLLGLAPVNTILHILLAPANQAPLPEYEAHSSIQFTAGATNDRHEITVEGLFDVPVESNIDDGIGSIIPYWYFDNAAIEPLVLQWNYCTLHCEILNFSDPLVKITIPPPPPIS
jgi:hypothetical protein